MYLSAFAHLKNKYPGGKIHHGVDAIDAYAADGSHRVAVRKNGAGQWVCQSEAFGLADRFCMSPIPKNARAHKLYPSGHVAPSEEYASRAPFAASIAVGGKVPSIAELAKAGGVIDQQGNYSPPAASPAPAA
jgi:hypothetical protein